VVSNVIWVMMAKRARKTGKLMPAAPVGALALGMAFFYVFQMTKATKALRRGVEDHPVAVVVVACGLTDQPEGESLWQQRKGSRTVFCRAARPAPLQRCQRVYVKGGIVVYPWFLYFLRRFVDLALCRF